MKWHMASVWEEIARAIPDAVALINGDDRRTWRDFERRSAALAAALLEAGFGPDSKIAVYGLNSNAFLEAHFAIFKIRGVPVNVNWRYAEAELIYLLDNSDTEAVIFDAAYGARLASIAPKLPRIRNLIEIDDGSGKHLEGTLGFEELIAQNAPAVTGGYEEDDV
jgi:fatty-acyl-CoA synthase